MNPKDADLYTVNISLANLSFASSSNDPFCVGDLDDTSMPGFVSVKAGSSASIVGGDHGTSSSHAALYHYSGKLAIVQLENVDGEDYQSDFSQSLDFLVSNFFILDMWNFLDKLCSFIF